jgi:ActR/RegA family two-component response regulator
MTNKALVILDTQNQPFDIDAFMVVRNLMAEYCHTCSDALHAIKSTRYRCIVVSTDMQKENPVEIIRALRNFENETGLSPMPILAAGKTRLLTQSEIGRLNISAQIHSHHLK